LAVKVATPVPPCATVTGVFEVRTVAEAFGNVNVFSEVAGPVMEKNPLLVPPLVPSRMLVLSTPPFAVDAKLIGGRSAPRSALRVALPEDPFGVAYTKLAAPEGTPPAAQAPSPRRKVDAEHVPVQRPMMSADVAADVCGELTFPFRTPVTGPNRLYCWASADVAISEKTRLARRVFRFVAICLRLENIAM
jgi:hypothetical protein